jgi:hypothetical protein
MLLLPNKETSYRQQVSPVPRQGVWPGRLFFIFVLAIVGVIVWQRQAISDWVQLYDYDPPAAISTLATQTTMTDPARHLFYLNEPIISSKSKFSDYCTSLEKTIVLGCYHGGQNGIFILEIADNSELHGVMQVTAAHEMLHSAYDRLSTEEKANVNAQLQAYYDHGLKDKAIRAEVDAYRSTEPGELLNEMHSIFGTEVAKLPAGLETYYGQYFSNRQAIVTQAERYQTAFRKREAAVKGYDTQLATLKKRVTRNEALLEAKAAELRAELKRMNTLKTAGNVENYNAAVPKYNNMAQAYNQLLQTTRSQITHFNTIVTKRNALVVEEQQLIKQLSGNDLPAAQ